MLITLISLTSLLTLGLLSVLSMRSSIAGASYDTGRSEAFYAAESGVIAARSYLKKNFSTTSNWSAFVKKSNQSIQPNLAIQGNTIQPGAADYPFSSSKAHYNVTLLNNTDDPGFDNTDVSLLDQDARVVIHSEGIGPGGALVVLEVVIGPGGLALGGTPCIGYAQKNMSESGSGYNPCLSDVNGSAGNVLTLNPSEL